MKGFWQVLEPEYNTKVSCPVKITWRVECRRSLDSLLAHLTFLQHLEEILGLL